MRRWDRDIYGYYNSEEPDIYQYNVILANPQDLLKTLPPAVFKKTNLSDYDKEVLMTPMSLDMQLVDETELNIKRTKINTVLADTDMESAILYVANALQIKNTNISQIDNTKKYREVIIPQLQDITTIFEDFQKQYGIFRKGIARYISNNTLYVFPPFDTDPARSEIVNIFKLPQGSVDGGDMYHSLEGEDIYIASFGETTSTNTSEQHTENIGNAVAIKQADTSVGCMSTISNDGTITRNELSNLVVQINTNATSTKDQVVINSGGTTANIFDKLSEITAGQLEHVSLTWIHAKPFLIKPGTKCILHYDDTSDKDNDDTYTTVPGIVESAVYILRQHTKNPSIVYRWDATIITAVVPKKDESTNVVKQTHSVT